MTKTFAMWLLWLVLRVYVFVARKPSFTFRTHGAAPYMTRWALWTRGRWPDAQGRTGGAGWYLHRVVASDHEREMHNHPAPGFALVLRGGYIEERQEGLRADTDIDVLWRGPGTAHILAPDTFHRITLLCHNAQHQRERPSWSLFYFGPRHGRGWGFLRDDGTVRRAAHHDGNTGAAHDRPGTVQS